MAGRSKGSMRCAPGQSCLGVGSEGPCALTLPPAVDPWYLSLVVPTYPIGKFPGLPPGNQGCLIHLHCPLQHPEPAERLTPLSRPPGQRRIASGEPTPAPPCPPHTPPARRLRGSRSLSPVRKSSPAGIALMRTPQNSKTHCRDASLIFHKIPLRVAEQS